MSEATKITEQSRTVRSNTLYVLEYLTEKAEEFQLPKPPDVLGQYHKLLEDNTYKVLVVGEAKRGKSTFINALIGDDILPTNVRVTTSQVFMVQPAKREAYRLRLEDGSMCEIPREELPRYGSQVLEDAGEKPRLDQIIRWIEVDAPNIRFLPAGVSLLDTPGLGALYAAHAQITHRFVPQADAVIFVLDSEKPIVQTEIEFIETILEATPDIFFIQTKIDQHGAQHWRDIQRRNQKIIREKFEERLTDMRVWPISSTLLLDAATGGEDAEEDLKDSRHADMEAALRAFLFRVAGWSRSAQAIFIAGRYATSARPTLDNRLAVLVEGESKLEQIKKQADSRMQEFQQDWGTQGQKRNELEHGINLAVSQAQRSFMEAVQIGGRIATAQKDKIEAIRSLEDAEQLNETMADEVAAAVMSEWRRVATVAQRKCIQLLEPFLVEAEAVDRWGGPDRSGLMLKGKALEHIENKIWEKSRGSYGNAFMFIIAASYTLSLGGPVGLAVGALGGAIVAAIYGWKTTGQRQIQSAQHNLHANLDQLLLQVRQQILEVDVETGDSMVDEYFASLRRLMLEQVRDIVDQKWEEAQDEYARLVEAGELDQQQREKGIEEARKRLAEWDAMGEVIEEVGAKLYELDNTMAESAPAM